jgi:hypothetical protein
LEDFVFDRRPKPARYKEMGNLARHVRVFNMPQLVIRDSFSGSQWRSASAIAPVGHQRHCPRGVFTWGLPSVCAGLLLMGGVSLAANDGSAMPRDRVAAQPDKRIETLLRRVEQQVSSGHAMSPAEDNAMDTWQTVLELRRVDPASPAVLAALTNFASYMKARATEERTAGRLVVSSDLAVFADQANRLLTLTQVTGPSVTGPSVAVPPVAAAPMPAGNSRAAPQSPGPDAQASRSPVAPGTAANRRDALVADKAASDKFAGGGQFPPPQPAMPFMHETAAASAPGKGATGRLLVATGSAPFGPAPVGPALSGPALGGNAGITARQAAVASAPAVPPVSGNASISREAVALPPSKMPRADQVSIDPPVIVPLATRASAKVPLAEAPAAESPRSEAGKAVTPPVTASIALATPAPARLSETASPPPAAVAEPQPDPMTILLHRGDMLLQQNDVVAARLFFERAAAAGSGEGATSLGKTYDPNFLTTIDAHGMKGDVARAIEWYRKASTVLGDKDAGERLKVLTAQTGQ